MGRVLLAAVLAALVFCLPAAGAPISFYQVEETPYDETVPTPESMIGWGLGERPVRHHQLVDYLRQLSETSDRITIREIGRSHERRPILELTITSAANQARIEEIRAAHLDRVDPRNPAEADLPAVVWINSGVHGAESSAFEVSLMLAYHFAAAEGETVQELLDDTVIVLVAVLNPDGHARRINRVDTFDGQVDVTDPAHHQHGGWINARTNHYWFDLNRQWLLLTQPEARAWTRAWHRWKPQVSLDHHEMGSANTFYFHPGEPNRLNPLVPERARELSQRIAGFQSRFFDQAGELYYAEERFDNFYIGKGSTYPQINGGIGILFEAGAAAGGRIETRNGERTYPRNIRMQFRAALAAVTGAAALREELADHQRAFFSAALEGGSDGAAGWVFAAPGDPARLARFLDLLAIHEVLAYPLTGEVEAGGETFRAGEAYFVPTSQLQGTMARGIFETPTEFRENVFYDMSAWTLPLAYDLDWAPLNRAPAIDNQPATATALPAPRPAPARGSYGYVIDWTDRYAPRAAYRLLSADLAVRVAKEAFTAPTSAGPQPFARGALFVRTADQPVEPGALHTLMETIAREDGVRVVPVSSGRSPSVQTDFGASFTWRPIEKPSILLLFDDGLSRYDAGEIWWTLDHQMRIPVTLREKDALGAIDWPRYSHVILVGGRAGLEKAHAEALENWLRDGGTLIASRQGAAWAQDTLLAADADKADGAEPTDDTRDEANPGRYDYSQMTLRDAEDVVGGAIFATDLDVSHPLAFGHDDRLLPVLRNTSIVLDAPEDDPFAVVAQYSDTPLLAGYASQRRVEEIAGSPAVLVEHVDDGQAILLADNPVFRGTFLGTERVFLNAIFLSGVIDRPRGDYEP